MGLNTNISKDTLTTNNIEFRYWKIIRKLRPRENSDSYQNAEFQVWSKMLIKPQYKIQKKTNRSGGVIGTVVGFTKFHVYVHYCGKFFIQ